MFIFGAKDLTRKIGGDAAEAADGEEDGEEDNNEEANDEEDDEEEEEDEETTETWRGGP